MVRSDAVIVCISQQHLSAARQRELTEAVIAGSPVPTVLVRLESTWSNVSWEEAVARAPDVIVINDYGQTSPDDKIALLKNNPALASVPAIQNDRFVVLPLPSAFEGVRERSLLPVRKLPPELVRFAPKAVFIGPMLSRPLGGDAERAQSPVPAARNAQRAPDRGGSDGRG